MRDKQDAALVAAETMARAEIAKLQQSLRGEAECLAEAKRAHALEVQRLHEGTVPETKGSPLSSHRPPSKP
jgi:hypothetical protein